MDKKPTHGAAGDCLICGNRTGLASLPNLIPRAGLHRAAFILGEAAPGGSSRYSPLCSTCWFSYLRFRTVQARYKRIWANQITESDLIAAWLIICLKRGKTHTCYYPLPPTNAIDDKQVTDTLDAKIMIGHLHSLGDDVVAAYTENTDMREGIRLWRAYRHKCAANMAGKKRSAEIRAKMSAAFRGRTQSVETRAKMSAANLGKTHSAETRAKMSAAKLGKPRTPETRAKIAAGLRGKPQSAEHRAKVIAGKKRKRI